MAKIEYTLQEKIKQFDDLQRNAEKFQQFVKSGSKEMLANGQQLMQLFQEFMRISGSTSGQMQGGGIQSPSGFMTESGKSFSESVASSSRAPKSRADVILLGEATRQRNARMGGVTPTETTPFIDQNELKAAAIDVARKGLDASSSRQSAPISEDSPRQKVQRQRQRVAGAMGEQRRNQEALKERLEDKYPIAREIRDPLSSIPTLSSADRRRASYLAATGKGTHFQYDVTDIPEMLNQQKEFGQKRGELQRRVETLRQSTEGGEKGEANRVIANALDKVIQRMETSNNKFTEALGAFTRLSTDPKIKEDSKEYRESLNNLRHSIEDLTEANLDLSRTSKAATKMGGGDGGGSRGFFDTITDKYRKYRPAISGVIGAGLAAAGVFMRAGAAADEAIVGAEMRGAQAAGNIAQRQYQTQLASMDMTNPENLLKYRADVLFGRRFKYMGQNPSSLDRAAQESVTDKLEAERSQQKWGKLEAWGKIGAGVASIAGGLMLAPATGGISTAVGISTGIGLIGSGIGDFGSVADRAANSRYSQLTGGLEGGTFGELWRGSDTHRRADLLRNAAGGELKQDFLENKERFREAEMRQFSRFLPVMQERQQMIDMQWEARSMVGGYATDPKKLLDRLYSTNDPNDIRFSGVEAGGGFSSKALTGLQSQFGMFKEAADLTQANVDKDLRRLGLGRGHTRGPRPDQIVRPTGMTNFNEEGLSIGLGVTAPELLEQTFAPRTLVDSITSKLGMSAAEFQRNQDMLTNVVGGGRAATVEQTERLTRMGRTGVGDFQTLLGNLGTINRVSGESGNMQKLEQIMATAVASGFDKSRLAQGFFQTTAEISRSLNTQNMTYVSGQLGAMSAALSSSGKGDEISLAAAATGVKSLDDFTKANSGVLGEMQYQNLKRNGITAGGGGAILMRTGIMKQLAMADALREELDNPQGQPGLIPNAAAAGPSLQNVKDLEARDLAGAMMGSGNTQEASIKAMEKARKAALLAAKSTMLNIKKVSAAYIPIQWESLLKNAEAAKASGDMAKFRNALSALTGKAANAFAGIDELTPEAGRTFALTLAAERGIINFNDINAAKGTYSQRIDEVKADQALQNKRKYIEQTTRDFGKSANKGFTSAADYKDYRAALAAGAEPSTIQSGVGAGTKITADLLDTLNKTPDAALTKNINEELAKRSRFDVARELDTAVESSTGGVQYVHVVNASEIAGWLRASGTEVKNLNGPG